MMQQVLYPQPGYPFLLRTSIEYDRNDARGMHATIGCDEPKSEISRRTQNLWFIVRSLADLYFRAPGASGFR